MVSIKLVGHRGGGGGVAGVGGCQNKHFGTFSQMNITRGLVLSVAQATLSLRSIRLPEMCYFL